MIINLNGEGENFKNGKSFNKYFINTGMLHVELIDEVDGRLLLLEFMSFQNLTVSIDCKMI